MRGGDAAFSRDLFREFCRSALGKATTMIRFLVQPLDPEYYTQCVEIVENIGDDDWHKIRTDSEDFLSLFALGVNGYTQRHRDTNDIAGGLAGLCTFGDYEGKGTGLKPSASFVDAIQEDDHLCVPQLNLKVPYRPGACSVIRGTALYLLVEDYSGPRFFLIGTNHESVKRHVWRKLGRLPPLPPRGQLDAGPEDAEAKNEDVMGTTCVNERDDDYDNIQYTNQELHEAGALRPAGVGSDEESP